MEKFFLLVLFVIALYYLYRKLIKNRSCDCGGKSCCAPPTLPKTEQKKND